MIMSFVFLILFQRVSLAFEVFLLLVFLYLKLAPCTLSDSEFIHRECAVRFSLHSYVAVPGNTIQAAPRPHRSLVRYLLLFPPDRGV